MVDGEGALRVRNAPVYEPLLKPARYKGAYGGRGSGKSHFFATQVVVSHARKAGELTLCVREIQKSLKESAKRTIEQKINQFGFTEADGFRSYTDRIVTPGDGLIIFLGMQAHTAESLKSLEGYNRAWCEQAETLSERSLTILRPTIRARGSELWFSWNPRRKADPIDAFFRSNPAPRDSICVRSCWRDNIWWNKTMEAERLQCLDTQPEQYDNIYEGEYEKITAGAYYAAGLTAARASGRLTRCYADPHISLKAFWDIGGTGRLADHTVIWIAQFVGREIRWLDYYEAQSQPLATHINWLRKGGYEDAEMVLPHDGAAHDKVYAVSYQTALEAAGFTTRVIPNQGRGAAQGRIEAARRLFNRMWFHMPTCEAGVDALGAYHEKRDEERLIGLGPDHDWSSHAADAFGLACVVYEEPRVVERKRRDATERTWLSM